MLKAGTLTQIQLDDLLQVSLDSATSSSLSIIPTDASAAGAEDEDLIEASVSPFKIIMHERKCKRQSSFNHTPFLTILRNHGAFDATTVDEWSSALHLADKWCFKAIKTLAVAQLTPMASPVDMIVLGRLYSIDQWASLKRMTLYVYGQNH
ncbi:hypothetical protein HWV62_11522 [Athelia sp. TMB]|nr:hypothetical protein HWV62_11522 [Athelia sp. TMB]